MKNLTMLIIPLVLGFQHIYAQKTMQDLLKAESTWVGEGYQQMPEGDRVEFRQTEEVTVLLDGKLLMFHGTGTDKNSDQVGFEAIGILFQDPTSSKTQIHAWTSDGRFTAADVTFTDSGFYWQFAVPNGGTVRYNIELTDTTWKETGSYSPNGEQWYPFMGMQLEKQ